MSAVCLYGACGVSLNAFIAVYKTKDRSHHILNCNETCFYITSINALSAASTRLYRNERLFFSLVERSVIVSALCEINPVKSNAPYRTVVHGAVIYHPVCHIGGCRPLRGTRNIGMHLARRELDADRYVEVVKYLESLPYSRRRGGLHGSRGLEKAARTNLEGGVTSPGIPRKPLPAPNEAN